MINSQNLIAENLILFGIIFSAIGLIGQYYWLNQLNKSVKQLAIIIFTCLVLAVISFTYLKFSEKEIAAYVEYPTAFFYLLLAGNIIVFPVSLGIRKIVHYYRLTHFRSLLNKSIKDVSFNQIKRLSKALHNFNRHYNLDEKEAEHLRLIYKQVRNHKSIPKDTQMSFAQLLIISGVSKIDLPRTYDINVDAFSSMERILQVAYSALKESKDILEIAPNASVCSCRKYAENLTRYLIKHHKLTPSSLGEEDNFSTLLYLLNQSGVIKDGEIIKKLYQLKEVGNDAAHDQLCDLKTARDIFDDTIIIETWFRKLYKTTLDNKST